MVTYQDPFIPLNERFPFWEIRETADLVRKIDPHPINYGWSRCVCEPVIDAPKKQAHWIDVAWLEEVYNLIRDDIRHTIFYFHQHPLMHIETQISEDINVFIRLELDSCGVLTTGTMKRWNDYLGHNSTWKIIKNTKSTKSLPGRDRHYSLMETKSKEKYPYKDGITIEAMDMVMEWLNL